MVCSDYVVRCMYVKVVLFIGSGVRYMLYSRLKVELVPIGVWGFGLSSWCVMFVRDIIYVVTRYLGRLYLCVFFCVRCFRWPLDVWPRLCLVWADFFRLSCFVGSRAWTIVGFVTFGVNCVSCSVRVGGCRAG